MQLDVATAAETCCASDVCDLCPCAACACASAPVPCMQVVEDLVKKHKTIGPLLRKVEETVTGTNTGKSPQLASYYAHWERSIFNALNAMVQQGMRTLVAMLSARNAKRAAAAGQPKKAPLFKAITGAQLFSACAAGLQQRCCCCSLSFASLAVAAC